VKADHGRKRKDAGRLAGMPGRATIEQGARLAELVKSLPDIAFNTPQGIGLFMVLPTQNE
jgi:hypothetical protein